MSEGRLRTVAAAFRALTGLSSEEFDALARAVVPTLATAVASGGGHPFALSFRAHRLLVVVWLRV